MDLFEQLENVKDKETFIAFVKALADERDAAARMEIDEPIKYQLGGALDWQNGDITSFLRAGLECFEDGVYKKGVGEEPTWKGFAEFLYFGKIYE